MKRSGLLALVLIDRIINGTALTIGTSRTTKINDTLALKIVHNNNEGILTFLVRFRELRGRLGKGIFGQKVIEIPRTY